MIDNKVILALPNIARNSMSLAYLTPGVVGSGGRRGDNNTNFVANGSRNSTSDVLVDGVTVVTVEQNSGITDLKFSPSVDVVQEFKMQTNFFSAEYGQTGGAVVNMVTRSGTNDFHGTGYYFLRDDALNANDWFANRAGRSAARLPSRSIRRRDRRSGDPQQDVLLSLATSTPSRKAPPAPPSHCPRPAAQGRFLSDLQRRRPVDGGPQSLCHA